MPSATEGGPTWEESSVSPTISEIIQWENVTGRQVPRSLGSDAWRGVRECDSSSAIYQRAVDTLQYVQWGVLLRRCTRLRNGIACRLEERYSAGNFKLVRRITFEDRQSWVVKVRMPPLDWQYDTESMDEAKQIASEVATLKYLKANSSIPVPQVHDFCTDRSRIGTPFIVMDYIHGSTPLAFSGRPENNEYRFGTPAEDWYLRQQLAAIQTQLATIHFHRDQRIGSLYQDRETDEYFIGEESRMARGPWSDSLSFYHDLADATMRKTVKIGDKAVLDDYSSAVPALFKQVMATYVDRASQYGPFGLVHLGLGADNVLVDHNYRIVGLMDVGSIIFGPVELQAQYPSFTAIGRKIPYCQNYHPQEIEHLSMLLPRLIEYKRMLEECEEQFGPLLNRTVRPSQLLYHQNAAAVRGLLNFDMYEPRANRRWMHGFARFLTGYAYTSVFGARVED